MNTTFKADDTTLQISFWPVVRFVGDKTANTIAALLEMYKAQNLAIIEWPLDIGNFAAFIEDSNTRCKACGSKMLLKKHSKSHFLGCSNYPVCENKLLLNKDTINAYLTQNKVKCKEDGFPLVAAVSKYGVYARCTNYAGTHYYDLDNI